MKYNNKEEMKEQAIQLYTNGKNFIEIAKIIGCSRNYVSTLIKNDDRVQKYKNNRIVKLYKKERKSTIILPISLEYWEKIGISKNPDIDEKVEVQVDEKNKVILIKKY